jgi:hypothetical protein
MQGEESARKRRRLRRVIFWLGAGLLVIAAMRSISVTNIDPTGSVDETEEESVMREIRVKTVDRDEADPSWEEVKRGVFDLTAGETTSISAQDLASERPLVLDLLLPAALANVDALPVRIISMDGSGELNLSGAVVASDRGRVRVQIESGRLSPGRYRIEIGATGQGDLAPQRYLLEIR